jgi:hypothetical protein
MFIGDVEPVGVEDDVFGVGGGGGGGVEPLRSPYATLANWTVSGDGSFAAPQ